MTENGIKYKEYGSFREHQLKWQDLQKTDAWCGYVLPSYRDTIAKVRWNYMLKFKRNFSFDLQNFVSVKGDKIENLLIVHSIATALGVVQKNSQNNEFLVGKISRAECIQYLEHNYPKEEYERMLIILGLN